jgi:hypothetical protein
MEKMNSLPYYKYGVEVVKNTGDFEKKKVKAEPV